MTTVDFITALFYCVDDALRDVPKHTRLFRLFAMRRTRRGPTASWRARPCSTKRSALRDARVSSMFSSHRDERVRDLQ
jgi:hypothetical protein